MSAADAGRARFWRASSSLPTDLLALLGTLRADVPLCAVRKPAVLRQHRKRQQSLHGLQRRQEIGLAGKNAVSSLPLTKLCTTATGVCINWQMIHCWGAGLQGRGLDEQQGALSCQNAARELRRGGSQIQRLCLAVRTLWSAGRYRHRLRLCGDFLLLRPGR